MWLTTTTHVSLDGVMQGMGGPQEDTRGGFTRGGWALANGDEQTGEHVGAQYAAAAAFLFGRWTYETFAGYWGVLPAAGHPVAAALHDRPKYVASTTLVDPAWSGTRILGADIAQGIRELKQQGDGELLVPGSGVLVRWLLAHDLVDRLELLTYPVVVGQGRRLFPRSGPGTTLDLMVSRTTPRGVTIATYRPTGPPRYATIDVDDPTSADG